jgi:D-3-phosphoglycerate dehydrogenase / 2-oxoglutarate reductase
VTVLEGSGCPIAPAELTWALIMNGLRQLPQAIEAMKAGHWQVNIGESVAGKTIGIWGYGKIGRRIARYAQAFDAQVLVWGSEASRHAAIADGYAAASSKEGFFAQSDVVTLHLRLVPATHGIVTAADLAEMKPTAMFVNTSRAALVEQGGLLQALQNGRPGFAALDVFDEEPIMDPGDANLIHPKVICTPHLGYVERNGYELYFGQAFRNLLMWFDSGG